MRCGDYCTCYVRTFIPIYNHYIHECASPQGPRPVTALSHESQKTVNPLASVAVQDVGSRKLWVHRMLGGEKTRWHSGRPHCLLSVIV